MLVQIFFTEKNLLIFTLLTFLKISHLKKPLNFDILLTFPNIRPKITLKNSLLTNYTYQFLTPTLPQIKPRPNSSKQTHINPKINLKTPNTVLFLLSPRQNSPHSTKRLHYTRKNEEGTPTQKHIYHSWCNQTARLVHFGQCERKPVHAGYFPSPLFWAFPVWEHFVWVVV